ncbi:MAG: hypothetical protein ABIJ14_03120 [Nanoarchaeota archaeon]
MKNPQKRRRNNFITNSELDIKKEMGYIKSVTRFCSLSEIQAWHIGESEHLTELIGAGFKNTLFVSNNGRVKFYYDSEEIKKFEEALERIDEERFGEICTDFMLLVDKIPYCENNEEKLELFSKMIPALTVFSEFDEYPEYMDETISRRLMRVRINTESKPYELLEDIGKDDIKDFIFHKGKIHQNKTFL